MTIFSLLSSSPRLSFLLSFLPFLLIFIPIRFQSSLLWILCLKSEIRSDPTRDLSRDLSGDPSRDPFSDPSSGLLPPLHRTKNIFEKAFQSTLYAMERRKRKEIGEKKQLEHVVNILFRKLSPNLWAYFISFEIQRKNVTGARDTFYRAIRSVPWNKDIWLTCIEKLSECFDMSEIGDFLKLITEKELRLRTDPL